ncbi:SIR2 family protein [Vibrio sp. 431]|nr:SIR2 family protein [Vibrio sp. 431]MDW2007886.1 SIR2 family protein [Vibrio sp. 431]
MKSTCLNEINENKIKSESELIFFIKNRISDRIPNYSLLLGSGCSVTSDIGTGLDLVEQWKKEYFNLVFLDQDYSENKLKEHLTTQTSWYKECNEYSSFFEKIYHLPVQRRKFIQSQVDGKIPSIGYAYLVSLCDKNNKYFDTIYTTNFDDLINDSFYQFGQDRPILCAHDSSVKSLSTHTERPKIIKLHGDYLYDDIKSTNNETVTLDKNTEAKFREFSKDFGLIVLGYAGNDDSVMNCIGNLLEDSEADYFENGIYWCVRKNDKISDKLKILLNKSDKVFLVEIEGFDEFMAKVNTTVKNDISILNEFNETKKDKIINNFVSDKYNLTKNDTIKRDIASLKKKNTQKDILEYIIDFNNNESLNMSINDSEFKSLLNIDKNIKSEDFANAKSTCLRYLSDDISIDFRKKILDRLISINKLQGPDYELDAIRFSDELIKIDEFESQYLIRKAFLYSDLAKRVDALMEGYDKFNNESFYLNRLSQCIIDAIESKVDSTYTLKQAKEFLEQSLLLNPTIKNKANILLLDALSLEHKESNSKDSKEKIKEKANKIVETFKVNNRSIEYFKLKLHSFIASDLTSITKQTISDLLSVRKFSNASKKIELEKLIANSLLSLRFKKGGNYKSEFEAIINTDEFLESNSVHFLVSRLFYFSYISLNKNIALDLINKIKLIEESSIYHEIITGIFVDIFQNIEDATIYLEFVKNSISPRDYYKELSELQLTNRQYKESLSNLETAYLRGMNKSEYSIYKSFIYLVSERYNDAIQLVDSSSFDEDSTDILEINKQFSLKCLGKPIDESKLYEIISKSGKSKSSESYELTSDKWICANIILDKNKQYNRHITDNIEHYPGLYYRYAKWPIIKVPDIKKKGLKLAS